MEKWKRKNANNITLVVYKKLNSVVVSKIIKIIHLIIQLTVKDESTIKEKLLTKNENIFSQEDESTMNSFVHGDQ